MCRPARRPPLWSHHRYRFPAADDAGQVAVSVISLDAKQLEQNGVSTNALEILRKAIPSFAGRSNAGTSNANNDNQRTAGGSQLQLRNLPTLILVNGRRVANSGVGASRQDFVRRQLASAGCAAEAVNRPPCAGCHCWHCWSRIAAAGKRRYCLAEDFQRIGRHAVLFHCLASRDITDTATWSGVVGSREPVTVMASKVVVSEPAGTSLGGAPPVCPVRLRDSKSKSHRQSRQYRGH